MRWLLIPLAVAAGAATVLAGQGMPSADALAARLQARYQTVRDFTADFTQTYQSGALGLSSPEPERGSLKLSKPLRFRMEYKSPEKKIFVADGEKLYSYFPADHLGSEHPIPEPGQASTALLFIAGRGDITRDFTASMPDAQPPNQWALALRPRTPQADFTALTLFVDRQSLQLRGFGWTDQDGGRSVVTFTGLRENRGIPASDFDFTFPRGTVIEREP
ncbi:MAG: outer membrane lipoprotein carrier protein LolA [Vicinamibacterales bacterium]